MGPVEEKIRIDQCSAVKNANGLNVSFELRGTFNESMPIKDLRINNGSPTELTGITISKKAHQLLKQGLRCLSLRMRIPCLLTCFCQELFLENHLIRELLN